MTEIRNQRNKQINFSLLFFLYTQHKIRTLHENVQARQNANAECWCLPCTLFVKMQAFNLYLLQGTYILQKNKFGLEPKMAILFFHI